MRNEEAKEPIILLVVVVVEIFLSLSFSLVAVGSMLAEQCCNELRSHVLAKHMGIQFWYVTSKKR